MKRFIGPVFSFKESAWHIASFFTVKIYYSPVNAVNYLVCIQKFQKYEAGEVIDI